MSLQEAVEKLNECAVLLRMSAHLSRIASEHLELSANYSDEAWNSLLKIQTGELATPLKPLGNKGTEA